MEISSIRRERETSPKLRSATMLYASSMPLRLVLVDDQPSFRSALSAYIATVPELVLVGEAGDGESAFEVIDQLEPDVVLMDWQLPDIDGIEATRQVRQAHPDMPVVMLSGSSDRQMRREAKAAGIAAVIHKNDVAKALLPEIKAAVARRARSFASNSSPAT